MIVVLGFLVREDQVEGDLVGLVDDWAMAGNHFADVIVEDARDGFKELIGTGNEFVGGFGVAWIGPENDDV